MRRRSLQSSLHYYSNNRRPFVSRKREGLSSSIVPFNDVVHLSRIIFYLHFIRLPYKCISHNFNIKLVYLFCSYSPRTMPTFSIVVVVSPDRRVEPLAQIVFRTSSRSQPHGFRLLSKRRQYGANLANRLPVKSNMLFGI